MSIVAVAKEAGVSHTTVSRVINNHPTISAETARQVRDAMQRLGYVPPAKRRGPRSRARLGIHNRSVALLVSDMPHDDSSAPVIATLLQNAEQALAEAGLSLMFARISGDQPPPAFFRQRVVDGLLMYGRPVPFAVAEQLGQYPCVWMLTRRGHLPPAWDCVQPDNAEVGHLAVRYLAERKHRRLAVLSSRPSDPVVHARAGAFLAAAAYRGLEAQALTHADGEGDDAARGSYAYDLEPVRRRVAQLAALRPLPTGLFVPNAELAVLTYRALAERGVQVGRDVDVVCCNRNPLLLTLEPVPAVIDVRSDVVGRRAVRQLLWRMRNRHDPSRVDINVTPTLLTPEEFVRVAAPQRDDAAVTVAT